MRSPLLTDISIEWNGMPVADVYPEKIPDLFSAKPVLISGRYMKGASGTIRLRGKVAGEEYSREIAVNLPEAERANDSLATLWARRRIDQLTMKRGEGADQASLAKLNDEITGLGLEFRILTENTSFVAVEDRVVNNNGKITTVEVPVTVPDGTEGSAAVDVMSSTVGTNISTQFFSNVPTSRTVQGLASVSIVTRSGLRSSGKGKGEAQAADRGAVRRAVPVLVTEVAREADLQALLAVAVVAVRS